MLIETLKALMQCPLRRVSKCLDVEKTKTRRGGNSRFLRLLLVLNVAATFRFAMGAMGGPRITRTPSIVQFATSTS